MKIANEEIADMKDLPSWLQKLWTINPTLAREAEKYLKDKKLIK
jgi:hypothetical protein